MLAEAAALVEKTEERFWEAEIYRVKGKWLLKAKGTGLSRSLSTSLRLNGEVAAHYTPHIF